MTLSGWTFDPDKKSGSVTVHVYIYGHGYNTGVTTVARADVKRVYGLVTDKVGFKWSSPTLKAGKHKVKVYAINVGPGSHRVLYDGTITVK